MKSIKNLIALSLMIFLSINLATAQRGGDKNMTPEARAEKQTERLTKQLSLTESQATKVATINLEYAQRMKSTKANTTDKEAGRTAMKNLRTEQSNEIKAVLTTEQLAKYNEKGDRKRGGKKGKGDWKGKGGKSAKADRGAKMGTPQERAAKQTERMTEQLGLTAAQASKISAINLSYAQKMETAKAATTDKEASKANYQTLRTEKSNAIKAVLTPEQLAKYNKKGDRKRGGKKGKRSSDKAN